MKGILFSLCILALAVPLARGDEGRLVVLDHAKLFKPETIEQAARRVRDRLERVQGRVTADLGVETVAELPEDLRKKVERARSRERNRLLREHAQERADEAGINGVFVLISQHPPDVRVVGWPRGREDEFTDYKRDQLRKLIARGIAADPDRTLLQAVDTFGLHLERIAPFDPAPLRVLPALVVLGVLLGVWVVLMFLRGRVASRDSDPAPPLYLPAMQSSLFGMPAGYWVTDRLFRLEEAATPQAPEPAPVIEPPPVEEPAPVEETTAAAPSEGGGI
jgi:hypothetical protein